MNRTGFTVTETVLAMSIAGVLVLISLPSIRDGLQAAQRQSAGTRFMSAHALARATAIRQGGLAEFHIDAAGGRFWIEVDTSQAGVGVTDTVRAVQYTGDGPLMMTSNRSLVCFDRRGMATTVGACEAGDLLVTISAPGQVDTLRTTPLGMVLR
jgi:Tfp pilus assembly protein FimT